MIEMLKKIGRGSWRFVSFLFWPQKTDKARYDTNR